MKKTPTNKDFEKQLYGLFAKAAKTIEWERKTAQDVIPEPTYRAWLAKDKKMVDVYSIDFESYVITHKAINPKEPMGRRNDQASIIEPEYLMPYSGMNDRNGKKIFHGDFVQVPWELYKLFREVGYEPEPWEVPVYLILYKPNLYGFGKVDFNDIVRLGGNPYYPHGSYLWLIKREREDQADCKIIGNMYENNPFSKLPNEDTNN